MNFKNIEVYSESGNFDNTIKKAVVYYEDGHSEKLEDIDDIIMAVSKFAVQRRLSFEDLKKDTENLKIIPIVKLDTEKPKESELKEEIDKKDKVEKGEKPIEKTDSSEKPSVEEKKDGKKFWRVTRRILAFGAAIVVTYVGIGFLQNSGKEKYSSKRTGTPRKTIIQEVKNPPVADNGSKYLENLQKRVDKDELYYNVQAYLDGSNKTEDNLSWILNDINNKCQSNIEQMNEFVDGKSMTGDKFTLKLSDMFEDNDVNHAVTAYFEDMCNDIRNKVYEGKKEETISAYKNFYNDFIDFVYCDVPITVNGRSIRYYDSEINGLARDYIMAMGQLLMEANIDDYNAMIGRSVYKLDELRTFASSTYVNLVEILYENVSKTK